VIQYPRAVSDLKIDEPQRTGYTRFRGYDGRHLFRAYSTAIADSAKGASFLLGGAFLLPRAPFRRATRPAIGQDANGPELIGNASGLCGEAQLETRNWGLTPGRFQGSRPRSLVR